MAGPHTPMRAPALFATCRRAARPTTPPEVCPTRRSAPASARTSSICSLTTATVEIGVPLLAARAPSHAPCALKRPRAQRCVQGHRSAAPADAESDDRPVARSTAADTRPAPFFKRVGARAQRRMMTAPSRDRRPRTLVRGPGAFFKHVEASEARLRDPAARRTARPTPVASASRLVGARPRARPRAPSARRFPSSARGPKWHEAHARLQEGLDSFCNDSCALPYAALIAATRGVAKRPHPAA
mmetsp:Transcript_58049/g.160645  ORF Transcript_58049/g.160645 Transcript_58049/m.160645 type:complete len:243 (-) Transcript_58049:13-741(-)